MMQEATSRSSQRVSEPPKSRLRQTATSGGYNVMSESTSSRRTMLGQSYYQDAKKLIGQALSADEKDEWMNALELYSKSLSVIRSGLAVLQSSVGAELADGSSIHELRGKMENMKEQIKNRMEILLQYEIEARTLVKSTTAQPSSRSLVGSTTGQLSTATGEAGINSTVCQGRSGNREIAKADVLFNIDTGIGLFEVDGKDHVRKYNDADALSVFKYRNDIEGQPPAFLQCGGFVYPLIPHQSPILKSGDRMYMFPELRSEDGSSVGVCLEAASESELAQLDQLLSELADLKTPEEVSKMIESDKSSVGVAKETKGELTWGSTVAGSIDMGVSWVSAKISQGTEVAGNLIAKGATKLRDRIEPNEKATEVPDSVQKGVYYTRKTTECVVGVSDFLMTSLARLTVKVGRGVKGMVEESEYVKGREVNPHAKEAWKATKSGLKGAAGVYTDLKNGASAIVKSVGNESSRTVGHKYGNSAEKLTDNSLAAAGNAVSVVSTYWSWKTWGITFIEKISGVVAKENEAAATAN